jgi:hypothetical protein
MAVIAFGDVNRREIVRIVESRRDTRHLLSAGEAPRSSGSG